MICVSKYSRNTKCMKKTIQFLFAMTILIEGQSAFAGSNEINTIKDKPAVSAPLLSPSRGLQVLILTVEDEVGKPIHGAIVNAPCTGLNAVATDVNGIARFVLPGTCGCGSQPAYISTPHGSNMQVSLSCSGDNVVTCNE